jgi:hypothetical protein
MNIDNIIGKSQPLGDAPGICGLKPRSQEITHPSRVALARGGFVEES